MAGSDTFSTYITPTGLAAADPNGISQSQTPGSASDLTINGALQSGGVATLVPARNVTVTSGGSSETGKNFTIFSPLFLQTIKQISLQAKTHFRFSLLRMVYNR